MGKYTMGIHPVIYQEYKKEAEELRRKERLTAQRCAELRMLARDFGQIAGKLVKLYTPEEKDQNAKIKLGSTACCGALYCRLRATKLEDELDLLRRSLREDTRYQVDEAKWEKYFLRKM